MDADALCRLLPWDTHFFGRRIARVEHERLTPADALRIRAWCEEHVIDCLYLLTRADDSATARLAQAHGFESVDVRLTLTRSLMPLGESSAGHALPWVRRCRPEDVGALAAIARRNHTTSRFYRDPHFDCERCDALYETWLVQSCRGHAEAVFVAESQGQPAGYLTCQRYSATVGAIGLVGVAATARGQGLGRDLLTAALGWFAERGLAEVQVVTQGDNPSALRLYRHAGFRCRQAQRWFHRWFAPGPSVQWTAREGAAP